MQHSAHGSLPSPAREPGIFLEHAMPLTSKGTEIMKNMTKEYGAKKEKQVFYASRNKGTIKGVDHARPVRRLNFKRSETPSIAIS